MGGEPIPEIAVSSEMQKYFDYLQEEIEKCYKIAEEAREKGRDPELKVEIPQAMDLAQRVEELVGPKNIAPKIREITRKIKNRELVSLEISKYISSGKKYKFKSKEEALDQAIRTGLAILTEGVLVAPLEGIAEVKLGKNNDGTNYVDLYFSGPIRSAGGTGQAMSVLIADVVRSEMGIDKYKPTDGEIERYKEEIPLYKRAQHLQYTPSVDEIDKIVRNCPICINGEGTEKEEVTGYRDLPRIETNRLRGGACLVIAEGLCLKAPKIQKHVKKLKLKGWKFLDIFINKGKECKEEKIDKLPEILPLKKYIGEVIAGRPVFSHPSRKGGFRLRYGRARTAGLASTAINPTTMYLLDNFIAVGTQLKTERPGKGTIGTPCTTIEGPIVLLQNGDLIQINKIKEIREDIKKIIDLGEILIPYGEFLENNSLLPDSPYVYEWWIQDLQKKLDTLPDKNDKKNIDIADNKTKEKIKKDLKKEINLEKPTYEEAINISKKYDIPLHPNYNLFWHDINFNEIKKLSDYIFENGKIKDDILIIKRNSEIKEILIKLGVLHKQKIETIEINKYAKPLLLCLGLEIKNDKIIENKNRVLLKKENKNINYLVSEISEIKIMPRAPFRIGTRMGRPEKAAERKMKPPPHVLFPLGNYGGNQRLVRKAAEKTKIEVEAGTRICTKCGKKTYKIFCDCGAHAKIDDKSRIEIHDIKLGKELENARKNIKERRLPDTIKGVIGTISKHKTPEPLEKGILRAKHDVYVFKDGTIRFDMTDAPLTHFKPREIGITIERLKKLGYKNDYLGEPLVKDDQICELKIQDVIISKSCAEYFYNVAKFVDDLLFKYYKMERFYNIRKLESLTGHLVAGLAPHTSAGSLARIIGFTKAQVCFSHPFYHAAKRRNCVSSDTKIMILNNEKPHIESIKEFYDRIPVESEIVDDFNTKKKNVTSVKAFSFSKTNKKMMTNKIKAIYKAKSPNHLLDIRLKSGRNLVVSPYHRCLVIINDKIMIKKALELDKNDLFLVSENNNFESSDIGRIDLLKLFSEIPEIKENVMIRNINDFIKQIIIDIGGLKSCSKKLKINKKTFSNYIYRDSIPITVLLSLLKINNKKIKDIPNKCTLSMKRDSKTISRYIKIDKWFMKLIGYYLAEGHSRSIPKNYYHVSFACSEENLKREIEKCISKVFKISYYKTQKDLTISSRIIYEFFTSFLNLGKNASEKRIPPIIAALPKNKIKYLLQAYFSGDGSVEKGRLHVSCSSINKNLLESIGFQLTRFGIFYRIKYEKKPSAGAVKRFYEKHNKKMRMFHLYYLSIRSTYARIFYEKISFSLERKNRNLEKVINKERKPRIKKYGEYVLDPIKEINISESKSKYVYDLEVENEHNFQINDSIITNNCDGDEDGLMLLMDALLNFSHSYIPDKRGGRMDLPLIVTTRLDPSEVDKEAHNVDTLSRYPLDFYKSTLRHEHSKEMESIMDTVSSRIGTSLQYENFGFTHDTEDISLGPKTSKYKTLKTMMDKMNAQLDLAAKISAVDTADVAYKVIERHFLPDIIGNMRAFSKQAVRCPICNISYRRSPLSGVCNKCGGKLTLTVHEKSVKKYLEISKKIAKRYNIPPYACQRINLVEKSIDSLFVSDKVKTMRIDDYF